MWYPNYCFSSIFEKYSVKATKYFLIGYFADQNLNLFEKFNDIDAVIDVLCDIVQRRSGCNQTKYNIYSFLVHVNYLNQRETRF